MRAKEGAIVRVTAKEGATIEIRPTSEERKLPPTTPPGESDDFFREVNDRIIELGERFGFREDQLELICECEDAACAERIGIGHAEFAQLRATDGLHLIAEGHERSGRVVDSGDGYVVVAD
jgi:hypothetical protein